MRVRFIVNPKSGREKAEDKCNRIFKHLIEDRHEVSARYTKGKNDAIEFAKEAVRDNVDRIVVIGGDGTVNEVVQGIVESESKIPLTIVAGGTTNDFAKYMELEKSDWDLFSTIVGDNYRDVDVGVCNGKHFINVGAAGIFTDVAHNTPTALKTILGRAAYIVKGITELTPENFSTMDLSVQSEEFTDDLKAYLFLISNTKSIGGFDKMAPLASVSDGKLDCILIKDMPIKDLLSCLIKIRQGEHVNHDGVVYFQTSDLKISCNEEVELDIDGEYFGDFPAHFTVKKQALRLNI